MDHFDKTDALADAITNIQGELDKLEAIFGEEALRKFEWFWGLRDSLYGTTTRSITGQISKWNDEQLDEIRGQRK